MSEKPYQKPADGLVISLRGHAAQDGSGLDAPGWVGTDLARFAQDVVALNSRPKDARESPRCQVAPLESMQRGLKIKKPADPAAPAVHATVDLSRYRKE